MRYDNSLHLKFKLLHQLGIFVIVSLTKKVFLFSDVRFFDVGSFNAGGDLGLRPNILPVDPICLWDIRFQVWPPSKGPITYNWATLEI